MDWYKVVVSSPLGRRHAYPHGMQRAEEWAMKILLYNKERIPAEQYRSKENYAKIYKTYPLETAPQDGDYDGVSYMLHYDDFEDTSYHWGDLEVVKKYFAGVEGVWDIHMLKKVKMLRLE